MSIKESHVFSAQVSTEITVEVDASSPQSMANKSDKTKANSQS